MNLIKKYLNCKTTQFSDLPLKTRHRLIVIMAVELSLWFGGAWGGLLLIHEHSSPGIIYEITGAMTTNLSTWAAPVFVLLFVVFYLSSHWLMKKGD